MLTRLEKEYIKSNLTMICHTTFNPMEPGVVRIHLIPPKDIKKDVPFLVILNGQDILPVTLSWAILLSAFIRTLNQFNGRAVKDEEYDALIAETIKIVRTVYKRVKEDVLKADLNRMISSFIAIARGKQPDEDIGALSIFEYAKHMRAPHRMDLMISAMTDEEGAWHCNQRCVHCYAAGQKLSSSKELDTASWKKIIDTLRIAAVAQLTFTGGEPTMRGDLVELIDYSRFFITRLNTNGVLLTKELCAALYAASLDSVQITLYSENKAAHEKLVGAPRFDETVAGIKNALAAGLSVSVNTPLCALNRDYISTLRALQKMGVCYFTCSGLIKTGSARTKASEEMALTEEQLTETLKAAFAFCKENGLELQFTSPGCLPDDTLRALGATLFPSCGAALTNMAIAPDGEVIPCQSWLTEGLGNILSLPFDQIWESERCRAIRAVSAKEEHICQLKQKEGEQR